jgi:RNA polymerase sigma-70 factor (ECF subfamily)
MTKEEEIFRTYSANRKKGFKLLMDTYQVAVYNYVRRMVVVHADAQDVMQEVFLRVYNKLDSFRHECALLTWIYKIATNESMRLINNRNGWQLPAEDVQSELLSKLMDTEYIDYENEMAIKFQKAIINLPEKQRIVFNLRYYEELEYEEISKITETTVDTLKVNYHYAKEKIKDFILNN